MGRRNKGPRLKWLEKRQCWYIAWTDPGTGRSRERSTGTANRDEAEVAFADFLAERQRRSGPRNPSEVFVTDVLAEYARDAANRAELGGVVALDRIGFAIAPLAEFFEGQTADQVSSEASRLYANWRNRSTGTVRRELGVLRAALNFAHRRGLLNRPVAVDLPPPPPAKDRWLTRSEAASLLRAARAGVAKQRHVARFILLALYSGKRKEAVLSLDWSRIDLDHALIDWERPDAAKTKKRRGRNPVNRRLLGHLRRWGRDGKRIGPVIHFNGRAVSDVKRGFARAVSDAGLEGVTPHTLRHTAATWLAQAPGVSVFEAASFLGMSVETFSRSYAHRDPEFQANAASAF